MKQPSSAFQSLLRIQTFNFKGFPQVLLVLFCDLVVVFDELSIHAHVLGKTKLEDFAECGFSGCQSEFLQFLDS